MRYLSENDRSLARVHTKRFELRTKLAWCQEVGFNLITEKRCLNATLMQVFGAPGRVNALTHSPQAGKAFTACFFACLQSSFDVQ